MCLNFICCRTEAIPLNPSEIRENNIFKESIKRNNVFLNFQILEYLNIRALIMDLIEDIEKELELKKIDNYL